MPGCPRAGRPHHLVKTFWGWGEQQLPAATLILTAPSGRTYGTAPGSVLLLPGLCAPAGAITTPAPDPAPERCGDRTAMMPTRRRTRAQHRADRIATERNHNRDARVAAHTAPTVTAPPGGDAPPCQLRGYGPRFAGPLAFSTFR